MTSNSQKLALAFALSTTTLACSALAASEGDQYLGLQYATTTFEIDGLGDDWSPAVLVGRFGHYSSDNVSLEGRLGIGINGDTVNFSGPGGSIDVEVEIDSLYGVYGVGHHTINEDSSVYVLIGMSKGKSTLTTTGLLNISGSESETDLSYGIGADFSFNSTTALNLEYMSYISKNDFDASAISFGFISQF